MDYIDSTENDDGNDGSLLYKHCTGYKYFYMHRDNTVSHKIRAPSLRKGAGREMQDNVYWLGTISEQSFDDIEVDPRTIDRPKAPIFGGHEFDDDDDGGVPARCFIPPDQLSDSDDESISSGEIWVEDVPCIDDAEFEALLHSSPQLATADVISSNVMPQAGAEDDSWIADERPVEDSSFSFSSLKNSESEVSENDRIYRIIHKGNRRVTIGNIPHDPDINLSLWVSIYESLLQELGYTPNDFRKGHLLNNMPFIRGKSEMRPDSGHSRCPPGKVVLTGVSQTERTGFTNRTSQPLGAANQRGVVFKSRSMSRDRGITGAKREPLRVQLLSGSILNRAIEWSLELPPSAFPLLSKLDHHYHEASAAQEPVLGARNERGGTSLPRSGRDDRTCDVEERTIGDSVIVQRPALPLGTLMMLNSHRLGGCELRAMESIYEVERL